MTDNSQQTTEQARLYLSAFLNAYYSRLKWYDRGIENEEMVYADREGTGTQYRISQLKEAKEKRGIALTVNLVGAIKEQIQAFLTGLNPSINVVPVGKSSKEYAYVWREVCYALWYMCRLPRLIDVAIGDSLVSGNGYLMVRPSNFYSGNEFGTNIEYVPWQYVYLDPTGKSIDLEDQEMIFIAKPITLRRAKKVYNLTEEEATASVQTIAGVVTVPINDWEVHGFVERVDKPVWVIEVYEKVSHKLYTLADGRKVTTEPSKEEQRMQVDSDGKVVDGTVVGVEKKTLIKQSFLVGNHLKNSVVLPCEKYPIIKIGCKWNKKPYDYPVIHDIMDLQKTFNTLLQITIRNAQVASNAGYIAPDGSIDKEQWQKDRAEPGGVAFYDPDPNLPNAGIPQAVVPQPLANAWYTLMTQTIHLIEYVTGIYGVVQGNPQNAPLTYSATQSLQDLGTQRVKRQSRLLDFALSDLLDTVIQYVQAYGKTDAIVSYVNGTDVAMQIEMNVRGQVGEDNSFQRNEFSEQQAAQITNLVNGQIATIIGDPKVGAYKVRCQTTSALPTTRIQALGIVKELLAHMSSPEIATVVAEKALELLDIPEADEMLSKVDVVRNMEQQIAQLSQQVETLVKDNQQLQEEVFQREKDLRIADFEKSLEKTKVRVENIVDKTEEKQTKLEQARERKQKKSIY